MKWLVLILFFMNSQINSQTKTAQNVLGTELEACCFKPLTGYFRDGYCNTASHDRGTHVVCAIMTKEFLEYTTSCGNDLCTPIPEYNFPGLKPGDKWCLCITRWLEAEKAGKAPKVLLSATHKKALDYTTIELLKKYSN